MKYLKTVAVCGLLWMALLASCDSKMSVSTGALGDPSFTVKLQEVSVVRLSDQSAIDVEQSPVSATHIFLQ